MDSVGIVSTLVIVGIILIFIIYFMLAKKKKKNNILNILTQQAVYHDCKISDFDYDNNFVIGIDNDSQVIFFSSLKEGLKSVVRLIEIQKCKVNQVTRSIGSGKEIQSATDRVELVFIPRDSKKAEIVLECYNANNSVQLGNELIILEKWSTLINNRINDIIRKK